MMPPTNGMSARKKNGPARFESCRRRQVIASHGTIVASHHSPARAPKNQKPGVKWKPPLRYMAAPMLPVALPMMLMTASMITQASTHHHSSLRLARPVKSAYLRQNREKATPNGAP